MSVWGHWSLCWPAPWSYSVSEGPWPHRLSWVPSPNPASFKRPHSSQSLVPPVLILLAALRTRFRGQSRGKSLLHGLQEDLRDNILNYDEQGGGEEDQVRTGVLA